MIFGEKNHICIPNIRYLHTENSFVTIFLSVPCFFEICYLIVDSSSGHFLHPRWLSPMTAVVEDSCAGWEKKRSGWWRWFPWLTDTSVHATVPLQFKLFTDWQILLFMLDLKHWMHFIRPSLTMDGLGERFIKTIGKKN